MEYLVEYLIRIFIRIFSRDISKTFCILLQTISNDEKYKTYNFLWRHKKSGAMHIGFKYQVYTKNYDFEIVPIT